MVLCAVVLTISGKIRFIELLSLFCAIPVRPAVLYRVMLENVQLADVFVIRILCEAMESFAVIFFRIFLNKEHVLEKVVFIGVCVFIFQLVVVTHLALGILV